MGKGDKCKRCKSGCFIIGFYKRLQKYTTQQQWSRWRWCVPLFFLIYISWGIFMSRCLLFGLVYCTRVSLYNRIMCTSCELNNIINEIQISSNHNHSMCLNIDSLRQKREINPWTLLEPALKPFVRNLIIEGCLLTAILELCLKFNPLLSLFVILSFNRIDRISFSYVMV